LYKEWEGKVRRDKLKVSSTMELMEKYVVLLDEIMLRPMMNQPRQPVPPKQHVADPNSPSEKILELMKANVRNIFRQLN
jgi:hypothetical protein